MGEVGGEAVVATGCRPVLVFLFNIVPYGDGPQKLFLNKLTPFPLYHISSETEWSDKFDQEKIATIRDCSLLC